jgi:predicted nuclease of predicted toxin-antitoxin system
MLFLFDENYSYRIAEGLHLLEDGNNKSKIKVKVTHVKHCGLLNKPDEDIIEYAGKNNAIIFTQDEDFRHIKHYYKLYEQHKTGVVVFRSYKGKIFYWDMVERLVKVWENLKVTLYTEQKPFALEITKTGISKLNF